MDTTLLKLFLLIAARRNISAAAREHGISPSLAVRYLARLEKWFGATLFHRTTRKIELTESGKIFHEWAEATLQSLSNVRDRVDQTTGTVRGQVRIACPELLALRFLPPLIDQFSNEFPDISILVHTTDNFLEFPEDRFDIGLHIGQRPDKPVIIRKLLDIIPVLCASPEYLARMGVPLHPSDLLQHRVLKHSVYHRDSWLFEHNGEHLVQKVIPSFETSNTILLRKLALRGSGIARLTRRLTEEELRSGRLVEVLPEFKCIGSSMEPSALWLVLPHGSIARRNRVFADALIRYLRSLR